MEELILWSKVICEARHIHIMPRRCRNILVFQAWPELHSKILGEGKGEGRRGREIEYGGQRWPSCMWGFMKVSWSSTGRWLSEGLAELWWGHGTETATAHTDGKFYLSFFPNHLETRDQQPVPLGKQKHRDRNPFCGLRQVPQHEGGHLCLSRWWPSSGCVKGEPA